NMLKKLGSDILNMEKGNVKFVKKSTKQKLPNKDFVQMLARRNGGVIQALMTNKENANIAETHSQSTNTQKLDFVRGAVVTKPGQSEKVYNITVEDEHEYFANGILTHNCDSLRYSIMTK